MVKLIKDVAATAGEHRVGLAVLIDEAQDLDKAELAVIAVAAHRASQDGWPVLFAVAGLPSLPRLLADAKSYTERLFPFEPVQHLHGDIARAALIEPAAVEGVTWERAATDLVVDASGGYPYFLQQFGQETWNAADGETVTLADARVGVTAGRADLDNGFFRTRWDRATRGEKVYLRAMAQDGDAGSQTGSIAQRMGRRIERLGPIRAKLIEKGIIYAPSHGLVDFTVPGMSDFILRQAD